MCACWLRIINVFDDFFHQGVMYLRTSSLDGFIGIPSRRWELAPGEESAFLRSTQNPWPLVPAHFTNSSARGSFVIPTSDSPGWDEVLGGGEFVATLRPCFQQGGSGEPRSLVIGSAPASVRVGFIPRGGDNFVHMFSFFLLITAACKFCIFPEQVLHIFRFFFLN